MSESSSETPDQPLTGPSPGGPVTSTADTSRVESLSEPSGTSATPAVSPASDAAPREDAPVSPDAGPSIPPRPKQTLAGRIWIAIGVAAVLLVLLIIFIAENTKSITISFLGLHGHISEALALLIAVVVGIVITLLVGTARILQLRLEVAKSRRQLKKLS